MVLEIRMLGPFDVRLNGRVLPLKAGRQHAILAMLAMEAGRAVSVERLIAALWQDAPPASVEEHIDARAVQVDAWDAEQLIAEGRERRDPALLKQALDLWRGPASAETERWEELKLAAAEEWAELEIQAGRSEAVIPYVAGLVADHPFRERLRFLLMTALHRQARDDEALTVFEQGRELMVEDLGLEPGADLWQLRDRIATGQVPAQLPGDLSTFTGRASAVARLRAVADGGAVAISGPGGIGKSALAIHVAHLVADRFPDGQLYINLHGSTPDAKPLAPMEALAPFLRALGVAAADISDDEEEAAALFRSVTHGRRLLIVLDNAADAAQLRPLIPGGGTCGVLITSRRVLTSVDGVTFEPLDDLTSEEARQLLGRLAGADRVEAEPEVAADLVRLCGHLPLALTIAGARLAARPPWTVRDLADRLADGRRTLDELSVDDQAIRGSFMVSYADLDGPAPARMFRLLGLLNGADISVPVAAALADLSESRTAALLDELVDSQLVESRRPGRYRLHDLLRLFARELAEAEESEQERTAAVRRGLHCYLATARAAESILIPNNNWRTELIPLSLTHQGVLLRSPEEAYAWADAELENFVPAARQAVGLDDHDLAAALVAALNRPLEHRARWREKSVLAEIILDVARRTGDPRFSGLSYNDLAWDLWAAGRLDEALALFLEALTVWRAIHHRGGEALALHGLGVIYRSMGRLEESLASLQRARDLGHDDHLRGSACMTGIALTLQRMGREQEAIEAHSESIVLARQEGAHLTEIMALGNLSEAYRLAGRPEDAEAGFREALKLGHARGLTGTYWEAEHLWGLGRTLGDHSCLARSAAILHELGMITPAERREIERNPDPRTPRVIADQL